MVEITLKNTNVEPVVSLTAIFTNLGPRDFDFEFDVSNSNPLLSGISISDSLTLIGAGFDTNVSYPLTIEGTLQNGVTFNYVLQIEIDRTFELMKQPRHCSLCPCSDQLRQSCCIDTNLNIISSLNGNPMAKKS